MRRLALLVATLLFVGLGTLDDLRARADDKATTISPGQRKEHGWIVHTVRSPYQAGTTDIAVLLPDHREDGRKFPVVYVLPVEAATGTHWGNSLAEVKRADLHNKYSVICVAPTFSHLPWYCDHPSDATIRQESYFLKVVVPYVERTYPALAERRGRLLVGFSKSGWGAWSLLLRHPDEFARAAAWDAPLMLSQPDRFGTGPIFGTQENFDRYRIDELLKRQAKHLGDQKRLLLLGYGNFREDHQRAHQLLCKLQIPHLYRDGPQRKHRWDSGWLPEAFELLLAPMSASAGSDSP